MSKGLLIWNSKKTTKLGNVQNTWTELTEYLRDREAHVQDAQHRWALGTYSLRVTMRYHYTPFRMAATTPTGNTKCWWGEEVTGPLRDRCWECKWYRNSFMTLSLKKT